METSELLLKKILESEKERKAIAGVTEAGPRACEESEFT